MIVWSESLAAPRSLATRETVAVTIIEDPGIIDLQAHAPDDAPDAASSGLPQEPWTTSAFEGAQSVCTGPNHWLLLTDRSAVSDTARSVATRMPHLLATDLTGALSAFRVVGRTAFDILRRVTQLEPASVKRGDARSVAAAGVECLLIREPGTVESWLVLAPRSFSFHMASALVEAARTPAPLGLFESAPPHPV
jgi:heterotetrameric sarcosine oxidase gamma subunit